LKIYQETYGNFSGFFARNFSAHRGSNNKKRGTNSMENQETARKPKKEAQWTLIQPMRWWIRIFQTPPGR